MSRPSRVFQRGNTWWFRAKVPKDLRDILGRREYRYSLKTKSLGIAASKANSLSRQVDAEIAAARRRAMAMPADGRELRLTHSLTEDQIHEVLAQAPLDLVRLNWNATRTSGNWSARHNQALDRLLKRQGYIVPANSPLFTQLRDRLATYFDETEFPIWREDGPAQNGKRLADAISAYEQARLTGWSDKTQDSVRYILRLLADVLGRNHPLDRIDDARLKAVHDALLALPPNRYRRCDDDAISLGVIASTARKLGRPRLSPRSVQTYSGYLQTFFGFVDRHIHTGTDLASHWKSIADAEPARPRYRKRAFRTDELQRLFAAPVFTGCLNDGRGYSRDGSFQARRGRFWVPLLALYGGVPLEDSCRLTAEKVRRMDRGYRLVIDERSHTLPEAFSSLGFDRCLADAMKRPGKQLFPELQQGQSGYYSDPFSQWFRRLLNNCGFDSRALSFHSLLLTHRQRYAHAASCSDDFSFQDDPVLQALQK